MKHPLPIPALLCQLLLSGLLALTLGACSPPEPIRIGFVAGISGRVADLGIAGRNAVILAVEQKNAAGGINGRPLELLIRDDKQDPDTARLVVQELINAGVVGIVGHMTSSMSAATLPLANAAQVPMISPTSTGKQFSGLDDHFFRVISSTQVYASSNARYHRNTLGLKRIAPVYDLQNRAYCESWLADFRESFTGTNGHLLPPLTFNSGDEQTFAPLAERLLAQQPQAILIVANSVDSALLAQQIRARNPGMPLLVSEWAATESLIELGGQAVEGMHLAQFIDRDNQSPAWLDFLSRYRLRFQMEPGFAGLSAHDAASALFAALESRQPGQSLKAALLALPAFPGLQQEMHFDPAGEAHRPHFITVIRDGRFVKVSTP